jgi:hypothetical protein
MGEFPGEGDIPEMRCAYCNLFLTKYAELYPEQCKKEVAEICKLRKDYQGIDSKLPDHSIVAICAPATYPWICSNTDKFMPDVLMYEYVKKAMLNYVSRKVDFTPDISEKDVAMTEIDVFRKDEMGDEQAAWERMLAVLKSVLNEVLQP